MGRETEELRLRLFELGEVLGFLSQPVLLLLMAVPDFQLFPRLFGEHQDVAHPTAIQDRVRINVPDLVGRASFALGRKVALRLAAEADHLEELDDGIVLTATEDLTQRESVGWDLFQPEHPGKLAVPVAECELVAVEFEQPDADRKRLEHVRQQFDRLAVWIGALRRWRRGP